MDEQEKLELEWLRFFYQKVYHVLGPADDDIIDSIRRQYVKQGGTLPKKLES
jgi:hypothetical protein